MKKSLSSQKFLVDTGASVSVFPPYPRLPPALSVGVQQRTTDVSDMDTFGSLQISLQFGSCWFEWTFLLADVSMPILGSDFLCHQHLLVNVACYRLLDAFTFEPIPTLSSVRASKTSELYAAL